MRIQAHDIPLPPMTTAAIYQAEWSRECRMAMGFCRTLATRPSGVARAADVADIMIDRGLAALEAAETNKLRLYASIGVLRFVNLRRVRFADVKRRILSAFRDNPPDSVRVWLESIEEGIWSGRETSH